VSQRYTENREWSWNEGDCKVWLQLSPDGGIGLTTKDEFGVHGSVHTIPPQVALRMAAYLTEMAHEIERKIAGGWVAAPENDYDDECPCCVEEEE
jgi:hypothetical protein